MKFLLQKRHKLFFSCLETSWGTLKVEVKKITKFQQISKQVWDKDLRLKEKIYKYYESYDFSFLYGDGKTIFSSKTSKIKTKTRAKTEAIARCGPELVDVPISQLIEDCQQSLEALVTKANR